MGIVEKWEAFRKSELQKKREAYARYAHNEADKRFNIVYMGHNVITFDGVVVSLEKDDETPDLCERLRTLREKYIEKLMDESGLWK